MNFWILPISGIPIPRSTVINIATDEQNDINIKSILDDYTRTITYKLGNINRHLVPLDLSISVTKIEHTTQVSDLWDGYIIITPYEPTGEESAMEQLDGFIYSQIPLETKNGPELVKVVSRKRDHTRKLIGSKHSEPTLDTCLYTVKFPASHFE